MTTNSTSAPIAHTPTRRDMLKAAPVAAIALAAPLSAFAMTSRDAAIVAAWERRVDAYKRYNASPIGDEADKDFWPTIDECDTLIHNTIATTPLGVELQIWTGLHNSSAYTRDEEAAILARDLAYIGKHQQSFDWDAQPIIAAIRSLRAMGSR